jgi:hypothetical protein
MSFQVSLRNIALGLGAGDIATLYSLGRTVGNWLSISTGDQEFLSLLNEDEGNLLRRRVAIVDKINFRNKWCTKLVLLQNGRPKQMSGPAIEDVLEDLTSFTICMICIVAVLDSFASSLVVQETMRQLLNQLLDNETLEDLLVSQLAVRIRSWRSAAAVREIHKKCFETKEKLERQGKVVTGLMPISEAVEVAKFL